MATVYTPIGTTNPIDEVATALDNAGLITTEHYRSATDLIITTPVCSKVIRIYISASYKILSMYYGDAWTSGTTITNSRQFVYTYETSSAIHIITDNDYFFIQTETGTSAYYNTGYVGKLTNGDKLCFGLSSASGSSYYTNNRIYNVTTGEELSLITWASIPFSDAGKKLLVQPLLVYNISSKYIIKNGSAPATVVGVKNVSVVNSTTTVTVGENYLITPGRLYSATKAGQTTYSSLIVQWD